MKALYPVTSPAYTLLIAAEELFATEGFEAVSTRMIAKHAGQKNSSALQYHFGDKDGLLSAILDYRLGPINESRNQRLRKLLARTRRPTIHELVAVFVEPLSEQLRKPMGETAYLSLLSQLYAYRRGRELYAQHKELNRAMHGLSEQLIVELKPRAQPVVHMRLQFMGRQTISAVGEWDDLRRSKGQDMSETTRLWRTEQLITYISHGLLAP